MPYFWKLDQYTEEWWRARRGIPTASQFHRLITESGNACKPETTRTYQCKCIAERLLDETLDDKKLAFKSEWVDHGHRWEAPAVKELAKSKNIILVEVGFATDRQINPRYGASPDALVAGSVNPVEVKCPAPWTQLEYLLDGPGKDYKPQVQGHLYVLGADKCHFFSYHPRMPPVHIETGRDEPYIRKLADLLERFCDGVERDTVEALKKGDYLPLAEWQRLQAEQQRYEGHA